MLKGSRLARARLVLALGAAMIFALPGPEAASRDSAERPPRVNGPLVASAGDPVCSSGRGRASSGEVAAQDKTCEWSYWLPPLAEDDAFRDYYAYWYQVIVKAEPTYCIRHLEIRVWVSGATVEGAAPRSLRASRRRLAESLLEVDARGHALADATVAQDFTLRPGRLVARREGVTALSLRWHGHDQARFFLPFGVAVSADVTRDILGFDIGLAVGYEVVSGEC